ncbi:MAG: hypothetical protein ACXVCP_10805 [Bdellovibrio sp.]
MGQKAKWLQDERYIRIAGAMLLVSPFLNYFFSVVFNTNVPDKWSMKQLLTGFMIASGFSWFGRISNFIVGFLMFRGKSSAWVPVLAILGFTIAKNIITFKGDFQINKFQTLGGLAINIVLFLLVFESEYRINKEINKRIKDVQLRRNQKLTVSSSLNTQAQIQNNLIKKTSSATQIPNLTNLKPEHIKQQNPPKKIKREITIKKGTVIDFDGFGKFAEVFFCSENELWLKVKEHLPPEIHKKTVVLKVPGQRKGIKLKFSRFNEESTLIFRVIA